MIREGEIEKYACVWVDEETCNLLRAEKKKQKKSIMRLIKNLVIEKYGGNKM